MQWAWRLVVLPVSGAIWTLALNGICQAPMPQVPRSQLLPVPSRRPAPRSLNVAAYPSFNNTQLDQQLRRYLTFVAEFGPPDVLIIGSSRALWGVDPIVLQKSLSDRGKPIPKVFNFGVNGATAQVVDLMLRRLLTLDQLPGMLVWADGVRAFNSGRVDLTYQKILASPGYQRLRQGVRPIVPPPTLQFGPLCVEVPPSYLAGLQTASLAVLQDETCTQRLKLLHRPELPAKLTPATIAALHEATGFSPQSARFDPDSYFQRYPFVPGRYDADYQNFTLAGEQTIAVENILAYARLRRIPVVFVSLPLTQSYLDPVRSRYEQQFRGFLQRFVQINQLTVYDLSQRWPTQHDYFLDPSHLNRTGAAAVSRQLGQEPAILKMEIQRLTKGSSP